MKSPINEYNKYVANVCTKRLITKSNSYIFVIMLHDTIIVVEYTINLNKIIIKIVLFDEYKYFHMYYKYFVKD